MALTRPAIAKETAKADAAEAAEAKMTQEGVEATEAQVVEEAEQVETTVQEAEQVETTAQVNEEPANKPKQEVAVAETTKAAAPAVQSQAASMAKFTEDMAEQGYEGLTLSSMSFDRIKLHEGKFLLGSDETELGTEFDCVVYGTKALYVVRQSTDNDAEAFYSYDPNGKTFTDGTSAREKLEEWAEDGYGTEDSPLDIRPYLEATVVLVNRDDEYEGEMVMLSIPPASKDRLGGCAAQASMKFNKALLNQVVTRCTVGKKVGEGQRAFKPWTFKVISRYEG